MQVSPYQVLGLPEGCSCQNDIKKAYRRLALQHHPDKNPSQASAQRIAEINKAYGILMDPEALQQYQSAHRRCEDVLSSFTKACAQQYGAPARETSPEPGMSDPDLTAQYEEMQRRIHEMEEKEAEREREKRKREEEQQEALRQQQEAQRRFAEQQAIAEQERQRAEQARLEEERKRIQQQAEEEQQRKSRTRYFGIFSKNHEADNSVSRHHNAPPSYARKDHYATHARDDPYGQRNAQKIDRMEEEVQTALATLHSLQSELERLHHTITRQESNVRLIQGELAQLRNESHSMPSHHNFHTPPSPSAPTPFFY